VITGTEKEEEVPSSGFGLLLGSESLQDPTVLPEQAVVEADGEDTSGSLQVLVDRSR